MQAMFTLNIWGRPWKTVHKMDHNIILNPSAGSNSLPRHVATANLYVAVDLNHLVAKDTIQIKVGLRPLKTKTEHQAEKLRPLKTKTEHQAEKHKPIPVFMSLA